MKNATRSILAVGSGFGVFVVGKVATGLAWGQYSETDYPNAVMLASAVGAIIAGYIAALVAGRSQFGHALWLAAVIIGYNLVVRTLGLHGQTVSGSWWRWAVGVTNLLIVLLAGGLFRYWQVTQDERNKHLHPVERTWAKQTKSYPAPAPAGCRPLEEQNRLDLTDSVLPEWSFGAATMMANQKPHRSTRTNRNLDFVFCR